MRSKTLAFFKNMKLGDTYVLSKQVTPGGWVITDVVKMIGGVLLRTTTELGGVHTIYLPLSKLKEEVRDAHRR